MIITIDDRLRSSRSQRDRWPRALLARFVKTTLGGPFERPEGSHDELLQIRLEVPCNFAIASPLGASFSRRALTSGLAILLPDPSVRRMAGGPGGIRLQSALLIQFPQPLRADLLSRFDLSPEQLVCDFGLMHFFEVRVVPANRAGT